MDNKCDFCTEKCPQAERAHQVALGRMYATKEFVALLKKVEGGELVEVVRCKDCKHYMYEEYCGLLYGMDRRNPGDFCSYGERKDNGVV